MAAIVTLGISSRRIRASPSAETTGRTSSRPSCTISLRSAPHHDGPNVVAPSGFGHRVVEFVRDLAADGIGRRAVQPDGGHRALDLQPDELTHRVALPRQAY